MTLSVFLEFLLLSLVQVACVGRVLDHNFSIEAQSSSDRRLSNNDGSPSHSWQHSLTTTKVVLVVLKVVDGIGTESFISQPIMARIFWDILGNVIDALPSHGVKPT
jgi:hypothetical protein